MTQQDVMAFFLKNPNKGFTNRQLSKILSLAKNVVTKSCRKLYKYRFIARNDYVPFIYTYHPRKEVQKK